LQAYDVWDKTSRGKPEEEQDVDKPTTVQQGGVGLGYVRLTQAKGKQDRRRVTGKTDT
jgi:hypothetical protein